MIKRLSTAAIGVALVLSATSAMTSAQAAYYGFDGRTYGEPAKAPNWGRPEKKDAPRIADAKGAPRGCLSKPARELLEKVEERFGPVKVISTCRPGARIAGSGRISRHASGNAVDFDAGNRKGAIIKWLVANHKKGGTMTYPDMSHIHIDIGQHFVSLAGSRKYASRSSGSSGRRYSANYSNGYDDPYRSSGRSRRYVREVSYERGYSSGYSGRRSGNSDYSNGYAAIYR